jgi:hypothetical protein
MDVQQALAGAVLVQVVLAVLTVQRHKVHIDYLKSDIRDAKDAAIRAHKRIDFLQQHHKGVCHGE